MWSHSQNTSDFLVNTWLLVLTAWSKHEKLLNWMLQKEPTFCLPQDGTCWHLVTERWQYHLHPIAHDGTLCNKRAELLTNWFSQCQHHDSIWLFLILLPHYCWCYQIYPHHLNIMSPLTSISSWCLTQHCFIIYPKKVIIALTSTSFLNTILLLLWHSLYKAIYFSASLLFAQLFHHIHINCFANDTQ